MQELENHIVLDECWRKYKPEYIGQCENCQEDIYEGTEYIKLDNGSLYCSECFERFV